MIHAPKAPLLWTLGAAVGAIAVAETCPALTPTVWLLILLLALGALWDAQRRQRGTFLACLGTCAAMYGLHARALSEPTFPDRLCAQAITGRYRAIVDGPTGRGPAMEQHTVLRLEAEACAGAWQPREGRVAVRLPPGDVLGVGDLLEVSMEIVPIAEARTEGGPRASAVARRRQIAAMARNVEAYALVQRDRGVGAALERWRQHTAMAFEAAMPAHTASLGKALALGDQTAISPQQRRAWADAGTAHLLSVSGLHVALVTLALFGLFGRLVRIVPGAGERFAVMRMATLLTMPGVLAYGLVTGGSAAALRAAFMACALLWGRFLHRSASAANTLGLAGLLLLMAQPMAVYDPGFWLSFVAVGALLALPRGRMPKAFWPRLRAAVAAGFAMSCAATAATAPLTAYFFGRVALLAPFTNLVAAPVGSYVATPLALLFALIAPVWSAAAKPLGAALHSSLNALDALATGAASLPWAALNVPNPRAWLMAGTLMVQHLYVGQGDATVVRFPAGDTMLIDAGGAVWSGAPDPGERAVLPALRRMGINHLDVVVATHPHPDHINGLCAVAQAMPIKAFWYNGTGAALPAMRDIIAHVRAHGGSAQTAASLPATMWRQGVRIDRLHPTQVSPATSANNNSVVLRLQYGRRSVLLAGDIEAESEAALASVLAPTDILKVPHHGSRTSSTWPLLQAARPRLAVVSLGDRNKFGFPHEDVVQRYATAQIPLWRTDIHGQVTEETDGQVWRVKDAMGSTLEIR